MITLRSSRLRVELAEPGEAPNQTFRFDRAGFITEVILDGAMRFCASEPRNLCHPSSGGRGLCNEFTFDVSEEAPLGEYFPKFGVGLLRRYHEGRYRIFYPYKDVQFFPVSFQAETDTVRFETLPIPCMGYALMSTKTVSVSENCLIMTLTVENTGDKPIELSEYCHNFLSIDGMALGSDYRLEMSSCPDLGYGRLKNMCGENGSLRGYGHGFTFCEMSAVASDYLIEGTDIAQDKPSCWKLSHAGARAWIEERDDFVPGRICLWAVDHIICPETSFCKTLLPGEKCNWTRTWRFEMAKP